MCLCLRCMCVSGCLSVSVFTCAVCVVRTGLPLLEPVVFFVWLYVIALPLSLRHEKVRGEVQQVRALAHTHTHDNSYTVR